MPLNLQLFSTLTFLKILANRRETTEVACEQALYSGGQRELFSLRAPKARVSANEVKVSEASPR